MYLLISALKLNTLFTEWYSDIGSFDNLCLRTVYNECYSSVLIKLNHSKNS